MPTHEDQPTTQALEGMPARPEAETHFRTIAVRVEESLHTQLRFIAQLSGSSISEEIRRAIEGRIATAQDDPELIERAQHARDEIEREAEARKAAIAGFMGQQAVEGSGDKPVATQSRARRSSRPGGR